MRPDLPADFMRIPIAHRGLHDLTAARPENSRAAVQAGIDAGYCIEIDLQLSADGQAVVFHDYDLGRLTDAAGAVRQRTAAELGQIFLRHADGETIPTLPQILDLVSGQVPVLIELKDQDGAMGPNIGALEAAAAQALQGYSGQVAVMSFNPHSTACMASLAPSVARGLVTSGFDPSEWPLSRAQCDRLRAIPDLESSGSGFISHDVDDLARDRVQALRRSGVPVLCYTIKSPQAEAQARKLADNVTFEGYLAAIPG